jgi:hypothetical protein
MNDRDIPTGLPEEPEPLDPEPNVDVMHPGGPADRGTDETETQEILAPGFPSPAPEPTF